jgi:hypothetical protein
MVSKGNQQIPYVMTDKDFEEPVVLDDIYDALFYHRVKNENTKYEDGFGRDYLNIKTYSLSLVFYFKNDHTNVSVNFISEMIESHLPVLLTKNQRAAIGLRSCEINVTNQDINKEDVYKSEFSGLDNKLDTKSILIRTDYEIEIKFTQSCTNIKFCGEPSTTPDSCPVITEIDGGDSEGSFVDINGLLDGCTA